MNIWTAEKDLIKHRYQIKKDFYGELNNEDSTIKTMSSIKKYGKYLK